MNSRAQFAELEIELFAGESYAGVYIPLLAAYIVTANKNASNSPINLQARPHLPDAVIDCYWC